MSRSWKVGLFEFCFDYPPQDISGGHVSLGAQQALKMRLECVPDFTRFQAAVTGNGHKRQHFSCPTGDSGNRGLGESPVPAGCQIRGDVPKTLRLGVLLLPLTCNPSETSPTPWNQGAWVLLFMSGAVRMEAGDGMFSTQGAWRCSG